MSAPSSGNYGDDSQVKALAAIRQTILKYDDVIKEGIESGNRWLDDALFPYTITLPLSDSQLESATFVVNYHAVMILKQHLHVDDTELTKWETRRNEAFETLKKKITAQTAESNTAKTFIAKSQYRSLNLKRRNA